MDPLEQVFNEIAPGVWVGNRPDSTRLPVTPNTTFIIGGEGVIVFDGGNLPLVADRVIAQIRTITPLPVSHVIISHWHMDHVLGVSRYLEAFPRVQILAHPYTRELIRRYLAQHEQDMRNTVPDNIPGIQAFLASGEKPGATPIPPATVRWLSQFVASAELLDREYRNFTVALPNLVFTGDLSIYSGTREIRILHLGAGNTPGDLLLWLPGERILATGDIVVWPTPYGHGGRAQEWAATLRRVAAMDFRILIPGHGETMSESMTNSGASREYLELLAATLESTAAQMQELAAADTSAEDAVKQLDLSDFEARFTHGDAFLQERLAEWFMEPIAQAAWLEASGQDPEIVQ